MFDFTEDTLRVIDNIIDTFIDNPAEVKKTIEDLKKGKVTVDTPVGEVEVTKEDLWGHFKKRVEEVLTVVT